MILSNNFFFFFIIESGNREYWKLQIHYNTPVSPKGYYDASGFRIRYSDPRPIDAGLHFFGWFPSAYHVIPGGSFFVLSKKSKEERIILTP